jgi:hypothetical protein
MNSAPISVEQWKTENAARLVECRWGCRITPEACRAYQSRSSRYVKHFNGRRNPFTRANAEYLRCLGPDPCPHATSDEEAHASRSERAFRNDAASIARRCLGNRAREVARAVSPDVMLSEARWTRSLIKR